MKVLVYYSKGNDYKQVATSLTLDHHQPIILWADNFKEANTDMGDALYICDDVPDDRRERILQHFSKFDIQLLVNEDLAQGVIGVQETETNHEFETVEEIDAYITELERELQNVNELKANMVKAQQEQDQREEDLRLAEAKAAQEKREAEEAEAKAEKEKQEAEEAERKLQEAQAAVDENKTDDETDSFFDENPSEDTSKNFEYPTREQMIMELKELKDEGAEIAIPRNATVPQIKPLYDQYVRKLPENNGGE